MTFEQRKSKGSCDNRFLPFLINIVYKLKEDHLKLKEHEKNHNFWMINFANSLLANWVS